jgi:hypothetical protein
MKILCKLNTNSQIYAMKNITLFTILLLFFGAGAYAQSTKAKSLKPQNHTKRVTHILSGKTRSYYSLDTEKASLINLRGPGKLRVITRARFEENSPESLGYKVKFIVDGGDTQKEVFTGVNPVEGGKYKNEALGKPGQSEDFEIELGRGEHSIELLLADDKVKVAARYLFYPAKAKKIDWISYTPEMPAEPIDLVTRESIIHYYRATHEKPLKVEVYGPTQIRVLTRIENHYTMRGRIHYRMQVSENGKVINTYQLSSRRSEVTFYKDNPELIPGTGCEFVIDVPDGKHTYEVLPIDKDKSTVLGRFMIPEKDVRNKE